MSPDREPLAAAQVALLEQQLLFAQVQFDALSYASPAHKVVDLASRLARLQARIDELAAELARARQIVPGRVEWSQEAIEHVVRWTYPGLGDSVQPVAVLITDADSHYVDASQAAVALLGYSVDELRKRSVADVVAWQREWTADEWSRYKVEGEWKGPVDLRRNDGTVIRVHAHAKTVESSGGTVYISVLTASEG
jgi:PAS domain S-box-containing protein